MSVTLLEVLESAQYNLGRGLWPIAKEQLDNVLYLVNEHDFDLYDEFDEETANQKDDD